MPRSSIHRLVATLDVLLAATLAVAALAWITGGLQVQLGPVPVSVRTIARPLLVAALLAALRVRAAHPSTRARTPSLRTRLAPRTSHPAPRTPHAAPESLERIILLALIFTAVGYWFFYLTTVCGGSDSYGYVSASRLLLEANLVQPQAIAGWLPVPNAVEVATPAGYVPSADGSGIVPLYPLGLPMLMAALTLVLGASGPYLVAPLTGIVTLALAWRIATTWSGPRAGVVAAALLAWNPLMAAYAKQPMSDVPASMWLLASVWCLVRHPAARRELPASRRADEGSAPDSSDALAQGGQAIAAGAFAGVSFLTRPGGLGAIAAVALLAAARPASVPMLVRFAAGFAPFLLVQAGLQYWLFGSVFNTGYGSLASLYAGGSIVDNLRIYIEGWFTVHTVGWLLAIGAALMAPPRSALSWGVATLLLGGIPYVFYFRFDHWETLRFLLPSVALLSMASAAGLVWISHQASTRVFALGTIVLVVSVTLFATHSVAFLDREGVPRLMESESRYPRTAERVRQLTPPSAVVFAAQHSGSLRHYADRVTLRWDLLRAADLAPALGALAAYDRPAFVALEGAEQSRFRERFADALTTIAMLPLAQVGDVQIWELSTK